MGIGGYKRGRNGFMGYFKNDSEIIEGIVK